MIKLKSFKKPILFVPAALLLVCAVFIVLQETHTTHFFESASQKQKQQETDYNNKKKEATVKNSGTTTSTDASGNPVEGGGTYTPPASSDNISITASQSNPSQVTVTTKLFGYSDGTCALSITNGGSSTSQNVQVIYAPEFSTCAGFSVPVSTLGPGTWAISLVVTSGGVTTNKSTSLEVH